MDGPLRQSPAVLPPIVAFDFDGTLTCRDSFVAFLLWRAGAGAFVAGLADLLPDLLAYGSGGDRGRLKAAFVRRFMGGIAKAELEREARRFAQARSARLMRPDAVRRWLDWKARGARLVIVTASPEILVAPFAESLGADLLIGTRLALDAEDRVTGALVGANCRGPEKVVRLREALGGDLVLTAAYGDSRGDAEMLAMASEAGLKVFTERP